MSKDNLDSLSRQEKEEYYELLVEQKRREDENSLAKFFPDSGEYARKNYPKQLDFFKAGAEFNERAMIASNQSGKSTAGAYEMTLHLTGLYPDWWEGRRFKKPPSAWACGISNVLVRDTIQFKLTGPKHQIGTGMLPKDLIVSTTSKAGVSEAIDKVYVRHVSGDISDVTFKSYEVGREGFQGAVKDIIWLDEECSSSIYSEILTRTATTDGMIYCTFTPLLGLSDVVLSYMPNGMVPKDHVNGVKWVTQCTWEDVPHISSENKQKLIASYSPHEIEARTKGVPYLGSGVIYPIPESDVSIEPFHIPDHWPRAFGFDVGWNRTAAVWGAIDPETDTVYLYSEYYRGQAEPSIHADAVKARGAWIPGVIDKAAKGRSQADGERLLDIYQRLGLNIGPSDKSKTVESGIQIVWQRLSSGKLKVFSSLRNWFSEMRIYRRDEDGKIVKKNDHLMDATRYLCECALPWAMPVPDEEDTLNEYYLGSDKEDSYYHSDSSDVTGY